MGALSWPSEEELNGIRRTVSEMAGSGVEEVRVVVSPYRICPLGAHIDHQGGTVTAMTIDKGILLGFIPSGDTQVVLRSGQFKGEVRFRVDETQHPKHTLRENGEIHVNDSSTSQEECSWGNYARGALYALKSRGKELSQGIIGYICGSEGLDSSGVSSSAAVGVAYLLAFESANNILVSPSENIEYDRLIENEYLGLRNGILDQSAILLSRRGCLTCMNCKTKEHKLVDPPKLPKNHKLELQRAYRILLAFSGLKHALTKNPGYNRRVAECQEAARILLHKGGRCLIMLGEKVCGSFGYGNLEDDSILYEVVSVAGCFWKPKNGAPAVKWQVFDLTSFSIEPEAYDAHKCQLEADLAKRAEHYFSENMRVIKGLEAWASGNLEDFGNLITASGLSSIRNYECGCEPLIQLYEILLRTPGVFGARFSGAGFRGCCLAFVDAERADEAASFVREEYLKLQPQLAAQLNPQKAVLICDAGDCAHVICSN
ncbi:Galacturonokinase [Morella rubra]|uniref:Galacturonokinase n=1 Tax=Morella rubra TaxID=262757 RepID=A0A6A1W4I8_9ROSI|nr:Galacturonokinase [Morella rubra]